MVPFLFRNAGAQSFQVAILAKLKKQKEKMRVCLAAGMLFGETAIENFGKSWHCIVWVKRVNEAIVPWGG